MAKAETNRNKVVARLKRDGWIERPRRRPRRVQASKHARPHRRSARYVAIVDGKPGAFGVVIPDLPGCTSGGPTVDTALRNTVEAVSLWVEDARADGEKIPKPRSAEKLRDDPVVAEALAQGGILAYVPLVRDIGRPVKANLSLDAGLLDAIDQAAERRGLTRSAFLASAAREKIESEG